MPQAPPLVDGTPIDQREALPNTFRVTIYNDSDDAMVQSDAAGNFEVTKLRWGKMATIMALVLIGSLRFRVLWQVNNNNSIISTFSKHNYAAIALTNPSFTKGRMVHQKF